MSKKNVVEPKKLFQTYRRILKYVAPYKYRLAIGILCGMVFGSSLTGLLLATHKMLTVFNQEKSPTLVTLGIIMTFFGITRGVGQFFTEYMMAWVGHNVVRDLRRDVFNHLQNLSVRFFSKNRTGELISRTVNDTAMLEQSVSTELKDIAKQPFALIGALAVLIWTNPLLALLTLLLFPLCIAPITLFGRRVRKNARAAQAHLSDLTSVLQEAVVGVRVVKAFGMEDYESGRFAAQCYSFFRRMMRVVFAKSLIEPLVTLLAIMALNTALIYAHQVKMDIESVIIFAVALVAMYEPVKKLSRMHLHIQQASAAGERIFEIIDTDVVVKDTPEARDFQDEIKTISFKRIGFAYSDTPVLQDVDFDVKAGERVAIVGSSGSGKTTLLNLIPRFYDPCSGALLLNGEDIRKFTLKSLRSRIGIVTQDTFLFNDTVANNIAYGNADASLEAIEEAARKANAHDFIRLMENGYNTVIGERGVRISGGQCQRLSIARALLRNPPILILDEATSALDTESERLVQAAINELVMGRTVFAVAHRLSTIIHCNKIVVLEHGRIAESGTHRELLEAGGVYKRLYDLQFQDM